MLVVVEQRQIILREANLKNISDLALTCEIGKFKLGLSSLGPYIVLIMIDKTVCWCFDWSILHVDTELIKVGYSHCILIPQGSTWRCQMKAHILLINNPKIPASKYTIL